MTDRPPKARAGARCVVCFSLVFVATPLWWLSASGLQTTDTVLGAAAAWTLPPAARAEGRRQRVGASQVGQLAKDLISELHLLRDHVGVLDHPPEAEAQRDRAAIHAYMKALEIQFKLGQVQQRYEMPATLTADIPLKAIGADEVHDIVERLLGDVREIKTRLSVEQTIEPASPAVGQTFSDVYQHLGTASLMLDGLRGRPLNTNDIFRVATAINDELQLIGTRLGVPPNFSTPESPGDVGASQLAQQILRATFKAINLQSGVGMESSTPPTLTLVRVTSAEIYDAANTLLAETMRIKHHLGVNVPKSQRSEPQGKTLSDSFTVVAGIVAKLDAMIQAQAR